MAVTYAEREDRLRMMLCCNTHSVRGQEMSSTARQGQMDGSQIRDWTAEAKAEADAEADWLQAHRKPAAASGIGFFDGQPSRTDAANASKTQRARRGSSSRMR